jgi:hypothetical protein
MDIISLISPQKEKFRCTIKKSYTNEVFYIFKIYKSLKFQSKDDITFNYLNSSYTFSMNENSKKIIMPSLKYAGRREILEYTQEIREEQPGFISLRFDKNTQKLKYIVIKFTEFRNIRLNK